jgi:hypothetical protein
LNDLSAGKPRALRLRAGDEFKHLEELAARITDEVMKARGATAVAAQLPPIEVPTERLIVEDSNES